MFEPSLIKTFRFVSYSFDETTYKAKLNYAFDNDYFFTEEIIFNNVNKKLNDVELKALDNCLKYLHLVAGSSYYKAAIPEKIVIENQEIDKETALFMEKLYINGLAEFAYRNRINLREKIKFPYSENLKSVASDIKLDEKTAIPIGGGKDSIVTLEAMIKAKEDIVLFSVGNPKSIKEVCEISGINHIVITRNLSPVLFELNNQGALNGHVPISAIIAFIASASSIIYGFNNVAMSNERSANVGNLISNGLDINHQYSKSLEFETDVSEFFKTHLIQDLNYFSFLRPLSELAIAKLFSKSKKYNKVFTSCNSAFKIDVSKRTDRWCLNCDKCRFVFLSLSPFIEKEDLISIFGKNMLNDRLQAKGYEELLGFSGHKPFECVGELEESISAFHLVSSKEEWKNDLIIKMLKFKFLQQVPNVDNLIKKTFTDSEKHRLNSKYKEILHAYSGA